MHAVCCCVYKVLVQFILCIKQIQTDNISQFVQESFDGKPMAKSCRNFFFFQFYNLMLLLSRSTNEI